MQPTCFIFLLKFRKVFWSYKKRQKKWSWKGTGVSKDKKFACLDNPGHNIWNKVKSSSKTGKEKKSLVSVFTLFLTAIHKV